ncbi:hypothetical protein P280DRAFT_512841 [Massarina eburnea CBS 473.64]|uniref:Uncharacterized protein n=1 Tax=Massarina eburnea CBS 473.64 TaxID=1395130 RepID=A0A6A6SJ49_9PLEO|nr:hypothetical protein P280DRAFT_512841 [Massarina eburnea CBS 473.64]
MPPSRHARTKTLEKFRLMMPRSHTHQPHDNAIHGPNATTPNNAAPGADPPTNADAIVSQPRNNLLTLPSELRLLIFDYMELSPMRPECLGWLGAYFTCRQLHVEMRKHLKPEDALPGVTSLTCQNHQTDPIVISPAPSFDNFGVIQELTVRIPIPDCYNNRRWCCSQFFHSIYLLYLHQLNIILTGPIPDELPYGDLKSLDPILFVKYAEQGQVNCKTIKFTLDCLANADSGRVHTIVLENELRGSRAPYTLAITQDNEDRQSERTFSSVTRFKRAVLV